MNNAQRIGTSSFAAHARKLGDGDARARWRHEIVRLAHSGHDLPALLDETVRVLRKAIPCEAGCWHALDPATLLETSYRAFNLPIENPLAAEIEYLHDDYNQFASLVRAPDHSGILSVATGGRPERSLRYRELLRPLGLDNELRAAFVDDATGWGSICLLRERSSKDFDAQDARLLEEVSSHVGHGIRAATLLREASASTDDDGPGLVLLDERQRLEAMTPGAERLLRELADGPCADPATRELPYVVHAVAAKARLAGRATGADANAHARVSTPNGSSLALHGCLLEGSARRQIAVIVERVQPRGLAPGIAAAYGLTKRESEMMRHLLQGLSTKQIAATLGISPYTVQEHFTAIFEKTGVRSRRELVGKVFSRAVR